ncbi:MAG: apolipoprotein N-acyltransferase [Candidatus Nitrohelix vancouverensis]|uniref:Apolipoprotein N-acyltransferase n=1 Tax=Candidatus Nitrohelix vancouverensis TaxID=2705534 RepID=A0A7T0G4T7_9BACT|nr:MAG: apolipoprotein N-acyltransferase [Candidatus Nitrohelix vancouverensis]
MTCGFAFYFSGLEWVTNTIIHYGNLPVWLSYVVLALMAAYLSVFIGLFAYATTLWSRGNDFHFFLLAPLVWTSLDYFRSSFTPLAFSWLGLGYSQFNAPIIIQGAEYTGVFGLTWLIVYVNAAIFYAAQKAMARQKLLAFLGTAFLLPALWAGFGWQAYPATTTAMQEGPALRVALAQGNIDQSEKWNPAHQEKIMQVYQELTRAAALGKADLIVWPEAATPFYMGRDPGGSAQVLNLAKEANTALVVGSPYAEFKEGRRKLFNSAFYISAEGEALGRYDKMHLVPFGEYVPFASILFFVEKMVETIGNFGTGEEARVFDIKAERFGVSICYELIFPDLMRGFAANGAGFLVNITNDAWFGDSAAPYQHISMAALRAVENRMPIVRAANTGVSGVIDRNGAIRTTSQIFKKELIVASIRPNNGPRTFYTRYGDVFSWLCIASALGLALIFRQLERRI